MRFEKIPITNIYPEHDPLLSRVPHVTDTGRGRWQEIKQEDGLVAQHGGGTTVARCWHVTSRAKSPRNNIQPPTRPPPGYIFLPFSLVAGCSCRFFCSVLVIVYQPGQTKRAVGNWVSHLLPDMIDKSPPSAISAKLLFRRAAARFIPPTLAPTLPHPSYPSSRPVPSAPV